MVIARGKGGSGKVEESKVGINSGGGDLTLGAEHTMPYADAVVLSCTLETCMVLLTSATQ